MPFRKLIKKSIKEEDKEIHEDNEDYIREETVSLK